MTNSLAFLGKINSIHKNTLYPIRGMRRKRVVRNIASMNIPPLNGLDIGIPLNIIDNVFTNLHYGYDITTPKVILLQFLIGYYTYGKDRYKDALEYYENMEHEGAQASVVADTEDVNPSLQCIGSVIVFHCIPTVR